MVNLQAEGQHSLKSCGADMSSNLTDIESYSDFLAEQLIADVVLSENLQEQNNLLKESSSSQAALMNMDSSKIRNLLSKQKQKLRSLNIFGKLTKKDETQNGSEDLSLSNKLIRKQLSSFLNSFLGNKLKLLFVILNLSTFSILSAQAGFWTFYFPNFLKPSGYGELTELITQRENEINSIKDNYADVQYFWSSMTKMDQFLAKMAPEAPTSAEFYPEDSVCSELFPMFRELAMDYSAIDYEHFIRPLELHHQHLLKTRTEWYPDGEKSKLISLEIHFLSEHLVNTNRKSLVTQVKLFCHENGSSSCTRRTCLFKLSGVRSSLSGKFSKKSGSEWSTSGRVSSEA